CGTDPGGVLRALGRLRVQPVESRGELLMSLQLSVAVEPVELAAPFRISGFVFERQDLVVVTLRDGSYRGRGEASGVYYLKDDPRKIVATIESHRAQIERGIDRES